MSRANGGSSQRPASVFDDWKSKITSCRDVQAGDGELKIYFAKSLAAALVLFLYTALFNQTHIAAGQSEPERTILGCWSQDELKGNPADKKILPMPAGSINIPPTRLRPTEIGPKLSAQMRNSIRRVKLDDGKKYLAITFDLCERENEIAGYDYEIVNYLRANGIKATFFAGGKWMRSHPQKTMQLMSDPLFEIGNHGWAHRNLRVLDERDAENEVLWTQAQYELIWEDLQKLSCGLPGGAKAMESIPRVPRTFRFPYGTCNPRALNMLQSQGIAAIQWDVVSGDPAKGQTASAIIGIVTKQARPGSIIIFHANGRGHGTAEALPILIPKLRKDGYSFVTVSELLSSGSPVVSSECYEMKPGDNVRYDKIGK